MPGWSPRTFSIASDNATVDHDTSQEPPCCLKSLCPSGLRKQMMFTQWLRCALPGGTSAGKSRGTSSRKPAGCWAPALCHRVQREWSPQACCVRESAPAARVSEQNFPLGCATSESWGRKSLATALGATEHHCLHLHCHWNHHPALHLTTV